MLTSRCNLRCIHCYNYLPKNKDLTTREIRQNIDQLADNGCLFLGLSGGEPLMREDFWEIAEYAKRKSFAIILMTNGTLITHQVAEKIKELNFFEVRITLLEATEKVHDQITTVKGSFQRTIAATKLLKEKEVNVTLITTVMNQNASRLEKMKKLANVLGVNHRFYPINPPTDQRCLIKEL